MTNVESFIIYLPILNVTYLERDLTEVQIHLSSLFPELNVWKGNRAKNMLKKWSLYEIA